MDVEVIEAGACISMSSRGFQALQARLNRLRQQEAAEHQAAADSQMPQAKSRRRLPSRLPSPVAREVTTPWPKRSCARRAAGRSRYK